MERQSTQHKTAEILVETYLQRIDAVESRVSALKMSVEASEDYVNVSLDAYVPGRVGCRRVHDVAHGCLSRTVIVPCYSLSHALL